VRTTLTVDDDVLLAVTERARRERRSAGAVLSDLARQALTRADADPTRGAPPADDPAVYGFRPLPHRGGVVSNALIDRLRENDTR